MRLTKTDTINYLDGLILDAILERPYDTQEDFHEGLKEAGVIGALNYAPFKDFLEAAINNYRTNLIDYNEVTKRGGREVIDTSVFKAEFKYLAEEFYGIKDFDPEEAVDILVRHYTNA